MSVQVENLEKSMAKLTIEVAADEFEAALNKAYQKRTTLHKYRLNQDRKSVV